MSRPAPLGVAFVGCGNIAGPYADSLKAHPDRATIVGAYDIASTARDGFAQKYDCAVYGDFDALLSDDRVDLVANLTSHYAHAEVSRTCLEAGKHVHSEKPLALARDEANGLVALARERGLRLSCATFTFLGEAQQTAAKAIRDGLLGEVRVVYAEMNWNRIEMWHPSPESFYAAGVGPLFDVGVYPLGVLANALGPVARVTGFGRVVLPQRETTAGKKFTCEAPDIMVGGLEFEGGAVGRLTTSFYVGLSQQRGIELHGDLGSLTLDAVGFNAPVKHRALTEDEWADLPPIREPSAGVEWGRAIFDVADALAEDRPHRASGELAAHVVDICCSVAESAAEGRPVEVTTSFDPPEPMPWAQ